MNKKNKNWFLEPFTKKYYKKFPIVTIFYYVFLFIVVYSFVVNKIYLSNINEILIFIIKIFLLSFILYLLKKIFEKNNLVKI